MISDTDRRLLALLAAGLGFKAPETGLFEGDADWDAVYRQAMRQTVAGVAFDGIRRLPAGLRPPRELLLRWYGLAERVKNRNRLLNRRSAEATAHFRALGHRSCILKGQANALYYPDPLLRMPGDIDIWVEGRRRDLVRLAYRQCAAVGAPVPHPQFHHVDIPLFPDVEVELHFYPTMLYSPLHHFRLQRLFRKERRTAMANVSAMPDNAGTICRLPATVDVAFQLIHLRKHVISGGIGLRQVADLACLLRHMAHWRGKDGADLPHQLRRLAISGFAAAMSHVLYVAFGEGIAPALRFLPPPDTRHGQYLLREILLGGNFGRYGPHASHQPAQRGLGNFFALTRTAFRQVGHYPLEVLSNPFYRLAQYGWRLTLPHGKRLA